MNDPFDPSMYLQSACNLQSSFLILELLQNEISVSVINYIIMGEMIEAIHVTEAVEVEEDDENDDIIHSDVVTSSGHLHVAPVEQSRSR